MALQQLINEFAIFFISVGKEWSVSNLKALQIVLISFDNVSFSLY